MLELLDVTPGSWAVDVTAFVGAIGAAGFLLRLVYRLVLGLEKLNRLIESDVVEQLADGARLFADHQHRLDNHEDRIVVLEERRHR